MKHRHYLVKNGRKFKFADDAQLESKDVELIVWKDTADKFKRLAEEKDKEIEGFKEAVQNLHDGYDICKDDHRKVIAKYKAHLESKDQEIEELKIDLNSYRGEQESSNNNRQRELIKDLESKDRELAQLKETAKNLYETLTNVMNNTAAEGYDTKALTSYAEWCKQNLK